MSFSFWTHRKDQIFAGEIFYPIPTNTENIFLSHVFFADRTNIERNNFVVVFLAPNFSKFFCERWFSSIVDFSGFINFSKIKIVFINYLSDKTIIVCGTLR